MYVKTICYGGACHQDMATTIEQLELNGDYNIPLEKVPMVVVDFLVQNFQFMSREVFEKAIENKEVITFPIKKISEDDNETYIDCEKEVEENGKIWYEQSATFDGETYELIEEYWWGQATYKTSIRVLDIPKENVWYLVEECFPNPYKYCDIVERIYVEPFEDLVKAKECFDNFIPHEIECYGKGTKKILVANKDQIKETSWYELNMKAISLMREKGVTINDESYAMTVNAHIEKLEKL
jgi:hypothetical protein